MLLTILSVLFIAGGGFYLIQGFLISNLIFIVVGGFLFLSGLSIFLITQVVNKISETGNREISALNEIIIALNNLEK